jgi:hypothetical protein
MIVKINGYPITTQFHQIDSLHPIPHQGIDLAMPMGTPIHSVGDGVITSISDEGATSFGKSVHVHMTDGHDATYGHLSGFNVHTGQMVHGGDVVGYAGSTGFSTGSHLHLQMMSHGTPIDPISYVASVTQVASHPWYDVPDKIAEAIRHGLMTLAHHTVIGLFHSLDVVLPTLCCIGIIWWMIPFFPKADVAPKLVGTSALVYMFYVLIRGAYAW